MILRSKRFYLIAAPILALAMVFFASPLALEFSLERSLHRNGFPKAQVMGISLSPRQVFIQKINLDGDGFTLAENISARINLLAIAKLSAVKIETLQLSGEVTPQNNLIIAGWDGDAGKTGNLLSPDRMTIENIILDFSTPFGAIRNQGRAIIENSKNGQKLTADITARQKQLSANIRIDALIRDKGWSGKIDIDNLSLSLPDLQIARASGWIDYQSENNYSAQMIAGAMNYSQIDFQDANLLVDSNQNSTALFQAKLTSDTDESFSMEWIKNPRHIQIFSNTSNPYLRKMLIDTKMPAVLNVFTTGWPTEIQINP